MQDDFRALSLEGMATVTDGVRDTQGLSDVAVPSTLLTTFALAHYHQPPLLCNEKLDLRRGPVTSCEHERMTGDLCGNRVLE